MEKIATVGGDLFWEKRRLGIRITNVQGVKRRKGKWKKTHAEQYSNLSELLGENWRVWFAKQIVKTAEKKGMKVEYELPRRFALFGPTTTDKEYKRQVRQARQTYKNSNTSD